MKKFIVIKCYERNPLLSTAVFTSDSREDAEAYAAIMNRNEDLDSGYSYLTAQCL